MGSIYLASKSPRRRELLTQIGVQHTCLSVNVPEIKAVDESPWDYVKRLACEKAQAGWSEVLAQGLPEMAVLGADTLGILDGRVFEKPADSDDAFEMLKELSGRTHQILSAVAVAFEGRLAVQTVVSDVTFRALEDQEIRRYWDTGEPRDKAGAYGIQGLAAVFVEKLEGSYSAVVGLPLNETALLLKEFGVAVWQTD